MKIKDIFEAFNDMGKLSDDELSRGQPIKDARDFAETDGRTFFKGNYPHSRK